MKIHYEGDWKNDLKEGIVYKYNYRSWDLTFIRKKLSV